MSLGPICAQHLTILAGASRRLVRWGLWGGQGEAARGSGGRGCARACQRVPIIIYDGEPMSLSARPAQSCSGRCGWRLDGQAGLPRLALLAQSPFHPAALRPVLGTVPPPQSHFLDCLASFHLSLTLFPCVCLSAFLVSRPCVPSVSVPSCPGSSPSLQPLPPPWLSPWLSLSLYLSPLPPSLNVCLALSSFLISVSLSLPLPPAPLRLIPLAPGLLPTPFPHTWLRPQSGAWRCGGGAPSSPCPLSPRGALAGLQCGRVVGADRVALKQGLARGVPR